MTVDTKSLQENINKRHAARLAKRAGAQISPEIAAMIRESYLAGIPIVDIHEGLRDSGIVISLPKVAAIAKTRVSRKKGVAGASVSSPAAVPPAAPKSGAIDQLPHNSGDGALSRTQDTAGKAGEKSNPLAGLTKANSAEYFRPSGA